MWVFARVNFQNRNPLLVFNRDFMEVIIFNVAIYIHIAIASQIGEANMYFTYMKLFENMKIEAIFDNPKIIDIFDQILLNNPTQES